MSHAELTDADVTTLYMALCDRVESLRTEAWRHDEENDPESYWTAEAERAEALAERVLQWPSGTGVGSRLSVSG